VFETEQLRAMSPEERRRLLRTLVAMDSPGSALEPPGRRRAVVLAVIIVCCVVLAAWIGVLAVTLPPYYRAGGWRGAWVGFDLLELVAFAATGWAAWRRRQVLIICLVVLATLLCCDAWFDVVLDAHTKGFEFSLLSALLIELPLAALAILGVRRLMRLNIAAILRYEKVPGRRLPRLHKIGLIGGSPEWSLSDHLFCDEALAIPAAAAIERAEAQEAAEAAEAADDRVHSDGPSG
jgi:hypothetical protein